ncbi:hypothetical protein D6B98_27380 [Bradyrhizobium sp. LVM 105]|nr:hypothetical protein D6B98_27380 [Bradyrhizobium sp. LVM 105]
MPSSRSARRGLRGGRAGARFSLRRHGRARPGHPRSSEWPKTWMPGTSPGMTSGETVDRQGGPLRARGSAGWPDTWRAISGQARAYSEARGGRGHRRP